MPFTGAGFINDVRCSPCYMSVIHCSFHWHHGSSSEQCCIVFQILQPQIQTWAIKAASYLARWIQRSHMQYTIEISSNSNFQISQGSVEIYLRWAGESSWNVQNFLRNQIVKDFCKSAYICRSNDQKSSVLFFWLTLYNIKSPSIFVEITYLT